MARPARVLGISIHAPRVGSDSAAPASCTARYISIHAPRVGSDRLFASYSSGHLNFNPRSPRGERLEAPFLPADHEISIHAPRVGSDHCRSHDARRGHISIHAPRVGSDDDFILQLPCLDDFNPRSPRGERLIRELFQMVIRAISIHAPRVGSDVVFLPDELETATFQSTLPAWGATSFECQLSKPILFQSTLPAWGATRSSKQRLSQSKFQSTLPAWGATSGLR